MDLNIFISEDLFNERLGEKNRTVNHYKGQKGDFHE